MARIPLKSCLAALVLAAALGTANAQAPDANHPGRRAGNGADRMEMMQGRGGRDMAFAHVEGRIAYIKADLKISDAQSMPWNAFADTMRNEAAAMKKMHDDMAQAAMPVTTPDRIAARRKMLSERLAMMERAEPSLRELYAALSVEQRKAFDEMMTGPMGMM